MGRLPYTTPRADPFPRHTAASWRAGSLHGWTVSVYVCAPKAAAMSGRIVGKVLIPIDCRGALASTDRRSIGGLRARPFRAPMRIPRVARRRRGHRWSGRKSYETTSPRVSDGCAGVGCCWAGSFGRGHRERRRAISVVSRATPWGLRRCSQHSSSAQLGLGCLPHLLRCPRRPGKRFPVHLG
jgi:hypothetical protein